MNAFVGNDLSKTIETIWGLRDVIPWENLSTVKPLKDHLQMGVCSETPNNFPEIDLGKHFFWLAAVFGGGDRIVTCNPNNGQRATRSQFLIGPFPRSSGHPRQLTEQAVLVDREGLVYLLTLVWEEKYLLYSSDLKTFSLKSVKIRRLENQEELIEICQSAEKLFVLGNFKWEIQVSVLWALEKTRRDRAKSYEEAIRKEGESEGAAQQAHKDAVLLQQEIKKRFTN